MFCTKCGKEFHESDDFCGGCGAKVQVEPELCASCGIVLREGNAFCSVCGTKAGATADAQAEPQADSAVPQQSISPQQRATQQYRRTSQATEKRKKPRSKKAVIAVVCAVAAVALAVGLFFVLQGDLSGDLQGNISDVGDIGDVSDSAVAEGNQTTQDNIQDATPIITAISAGGYHTVWLNTDGTVTAVGSNLHGQLDVGGWTNIIAISAGYEHTVGLRADGTVVATGNNYYWNGERVGHLDVESWTNIIAISTGPAHTVGLRADGTVVAVGDNYDWWYGERLGRLDVESWTDIVAISAGTHTVGLKSDGTVITAGVDWYHMHNVEGWTDIIAISTDIGLDGHPLTFGLRSNGSVVNSRWTEDNYDFDDIFAGFSSGIIAISSSEDGFLVGLRNDGTVITNGFGWDHRQSDVESWTEIVAISAGLSHTVGLKADGTVVAVGDNSAGQLNVGFWTNIVTVAAGHFYSFDDERERHIHGFTVGLRTDGTVVAAGDMSYSMSDINSWADVNGLAAANGSVWSGLIVGLRTDGTVVTSHQGYFDLSNWSNIVSVSAGRRLAAGLRANGTVASTLEQQELNNWTDIVAISAGGNTFFNNHIVGLRSDGTVLSVGSHGTHIPHSELISDYTFIPDNRLEVNDWTDIIAISAGDSHTVGLRADGTVVAVGSSQSLVWDDNNYRDLITITDDRLSVNDWADIIAIFAGGRSTFGLRADGTVIAVGDNSHGQLNVAEWTDIVYISAGWYHTVGVRADGTVVAAGNNNSGQLYVGD